MSRLGQSRRSDLRRRSAAFVALVHEGFLVVVDARSDLRRRSAAFVAARHGVAALRAEVVGSSKAIRCLCCRNERDEHETRDRVGSSKAIRCLCCPCGGRGGTCSGVGSDLRRRSAAFVAQVAGARDRLPVPRRIFEGDPLPLLLERHGLRRPVRDVGSSKAIRCLCCVPMYRLPTRALGEGRIFEGDPLPLLPGAPEHDLGHAPLVGSSKAIRCLCCPSSGPACASTSSSDLRRRSAAFVASWGTHAERGSRSRIFEGDPLPLLPRCRRRAWGAPASRIFEGDPLPLLHEARRWAHPRSEARIFEGDPLPLLPASGWACRARRCAAKRSADLRRRSAAFVAAIVGCRVISPSHEASCERVPV